MKNIIIANLLIFTIFSIQKVTAGDEANNGGGSSEKTFLYVLDNLDKIIPLAIKQGVTSFSRTELKILKDIKKIVPDVRKQQESLIFISEKQNPGTFLIDGSYKVAKTSLNKIAPIYINTDLIYQKDRNGNIQSISFSMVVSILIHEIGHLAGELDHNKLDIIGNKVASFASSISQKVSLDHHNPDIFALTFNYQTNEMLPDLFLSTRYKTHSLRDEIYKSVSCWNDKKPVSYWLDNLHWGSQVYHIGIFEDDSSSQELKMRLNLVCPNNEKKVFTNEFIITLFFSHESPNSTPGRVKIGKLLKSKTMFVQKDYLRDILN